MHIHSSILTLHNNHHDFMPLHARLQACSLGKLVRRNAFQYRIDPLVTHVSRLCTSAVRYNGAATTHAAVPLRKQLKDEAKRKKKSALAADSKTRSQRLESAWELTVGIEVHAELNTAHKLFSSASTSVNADPNTHVAKFDAALPGTQPAFQVATLIPALRAALAFHCDIQPRSSWDRKHYFYQDQPNGYQITQYYGTGDTHPA